MKGENLKLELGRNVKARNKVEISEDRTNKAKHSPNQIKQRGKS